MADYTVYVNSSSFTKDAPAPGGIDITDNPLIVNPGDKISFEPGNYPARPVKLSGGPPNLFNPNPPNSTIDVPAELTVSAAGSFSKGGTYSYTLSVVGTEEEGFTGKIKVN